MTLTKILVPIALSPGCAWAAQYAAQLARRFDSTLLFVYVGEDSPEIVAAFLRANTVDAPYEIHILQGDPADAIVLFAREESPSLIVMPTHAQSRFRRFLLGSVTAKVLHDVDCPVLTGVHRQGVPLPGRADFHNIVCAVDSDPAFLPVIQGALEFSSLVNASLTVVHAIPAADETSDNPGEVEVREYLFRMAQEKFAQLQREAHVNVEISLLGGAVSTVVREAALRVNAELVIIGRGQTQRVLGRLRTHAYSIIQSSPCPVLSL